MNHTIAKALQAINILALSIQLLLQARKLGGKLTVLINKSLHQK